MIRKISRRCSVKVFELKAISAHSILPRVSRHEHACPDLTRRTLTSGQETFKLQRLNGLMRSTVLHDTRHGRVDTNKCPNLHVTPWPHSTGAPPTADDHVWPNLFQYGAAKEGIRGVLKDSPNHVKVLQQLGWLYHQAGASFANQETAIMLITKSLESDPSDAQSWYLLGRAYMAGQKYQKAYKSYQQAMYRDGRNPTFWCSIGVFYYNINQFRDALDAYSRTIRGAD
ncbi:hypothetical protein FS749_005633 [Ceratobasidium sp. UAMH 11750]|nr:hypothetical protein FS749_005633 [Ceratobasidium sp. UAMH 11750]